MEQGRRKYLKSWGGGRSKRVRSKTIEMIGDKEV